MEDVRTGKSPAWCIGTVNFKQIDQSMKRFLAIVTAVLCICGCEKIFTPSSVTLSAEKQSVTIETTIHPASLGISDFDGNGADLPKYDEETKTYTVSYAWLTASISDLSYENGRYTLVISVQRNATGKSRTLYISGMDNNYQDSMAVTQKK